MASLFRCIEAVQFFALAFERFHPSSLANLIGQKLPVVAPLRRGLIRFIEILGAKNLVAINRLQVPIQRSCSYPFGPFHTLTQRPDSQNMGKQVVIRFSAMLENEGCSKKNRGL